MFRTYGTHQDQLRRVSESMRALYHLPRMPGKVHASGITGQGSISLLNVAILQECLNQGKKDVGPRPVPNHETGLSNGSSDTAPVVVTCRRCGAKFPEIDFAYTKETGLCIPCWETGVIKTERCRKQSAGTDSTRSKSMKSRAT